MTAHGWRKRQIMQWIPEERMSVKDMNIKAMKQALGNAKRNERHRNVAETRYWLEQYKIIASDAIKALAAAENQIPAEMNIKAMKVEGPLHVVCQCDKCKAEKQEPLTDWQKDWFYSLILAMQAKRDERAEQLKREQRKRKWVGLTDEEITELHHEIKVRLMGTYKTEDIYRAIEAKLRDKNI